MRKIHALAMCLALAFAGLVSGVAAPPAHAQMMSEFSPDQVRQAFSQAGLTDVSTGARGANVTIMGRDRAGLTLVAVVMACADGRRCLGLEMQYVFSLPPGKTATLNSVNAFNRKYNFAKAHVSSEGMVRLTRYLISDYGISYGNLVSNIRNFVAMPSRLMNEVKLVDSPSS
jgi:Putative bacterial sensory transduction regulator